MHPRSIGETPAERCERCAGVWLTAAVFNELLINSEWQRAVLESREFAGAAPDSGEPLRCPECRKQMRRANLGRRSGVLVDACRRHGIWFDVGELRRAVGFLTNHLERAELDARIALALAEADLGDKPLPWHARVASFLADLLSSP